MADVKDILNISTDKTPSKVESILVGKKRAAAPAKRKKPEGVSREVFALQESALLGAGQPIVAPPPQAPIFKEKRVTTTEDEKVSWVWKGFRNSARRDNAIFKHWVRTDDKSEDYKFARYNRKLKLQSYTSDEYTKHFQDPNWTREETDLLFDLCRKFDLRFVIIHDRFESEKPKSVEDLKERFYSISSKLLELHKMPDEDLSPNPLFNYTFNKKQEEERKQQSDKLFLRTAAQVLEEESLVEKFRQLEGEMKKHNKAKKRIAHLMQYALNPNAAPATPTTPTSSFTASDYTTPPPQQQRKKRKTHPDDDEAYEPEAAEYEPAVAVRRNRSVDKSATRFQSTPLTMGTKTAYRVDSALIELGIIRTDSPPVPAPSVTKAVNDLKQDLVILLDLQKYVPQKEYHLEVIKAHRDALMKEMQTKNIPIPQFTNPDKNMLASSSSSVFGLASIGDAEDSELLGLEAELFAPPPPSRVRRDKEGKRNYKKHKAPVG